MIILQETLRAVFYAPFYAAMAGGALQAEGVSVRFVSSPEPRAAATRLMQGIVDVTWGGPMRLMQCYDSMPGCDLVCFCEVVARDPFTLVGRAPNPQFRLSDLVGIQFASLAEVPTPWLCLQDDLRKAGIDPRSLRRVADRSIGDNLNALRVGEVDVIQVPEVHVQEMLDEGVGYIWYQAAARGPTSYTALYTKRSFLAEHPEEAAALVRSVHRTQKWVASAPAEVVAELVGSYFPQVPIVRLASSIRRYQQAQIWGSDPVLERTGYERLRKAIVTSKFATGVPFEVAVDNRFAQASVEADPSALEPQSA